MDLVLPEAVRHGLGLDAETLAFGQMAVRGVITFAAGIAMVRVGGRRFLGKDTSFDVLLSIILGAVLAAGITGSAPFFAALGTSVLLVALHWVTAFAAFHSTRFSTLMKGDSRPLIRQGRIDHEALRRSHVSEEDLLGALRSSGVDDPEEVEEARLERNGEISVVERSAS